LDLELDLTANSPPRSLTDEAELISAALKRLPQEQRQAIEMAFYGGLSQTQIASELDQPLGTVKARIRRGMQRLREEIEPAFLEQLKSSPMRAAL